MTGNRGSRTAGADGDQRTTEKGVTGDGHLIERRELLQSVSSQFVAPLEPGPDPADSLPEYHGSWYRKGTMREEVRATIEGQVAWLREIDDKAMRTLRFNTVLLGLVVPAFSFAVRFGLTTEIQAFYTSYTALGLTSLVASTALAGLTYTSSNVETGVSSDDVRIAKRRGLTDEEVHDVLLDSYADWIRSNRETVYWNTVLVTLTVFLTIAAFVFLTLGLASAILGGVPKTIEYSAYTGLLVVGIVSYFV